MDHHSAAQKLASSLAALQSVNPGMRPGPAPPSGPASHVSVCGTQTMMLAGGAVVSNLMHPTFVPLEHLFRRRPDEGVYLASPQRNYKFELGAIRVPAQMAFAMVNYRFDIYRLNGAVPGDAVPIEERRLSTHIGYDVNVDMFRKSNLQYQLEPAPITPFDQAFVPPAPSPGVIAAGSDFAGVQPPQIGNPFFPPSSPPLGANAADFVLAQAAQFAAPSGVGLSTLPQRTERQGPLQLPFTIIVRPNGRIAFDVIVFRGVPIPLAFFEVSVTGILMPANDLDMILRSMKPCEPQRDAMGGMR